MLRLVCAFISALYRLTCEKAGVEQHPLKGIYQMLKIIAIMLGAIVIISVLVGKSPVVILTGLGVVAAALTFVFQDTILGLVAGVQLSANDMLKPGDWIVAPKYGADGTVIDVTLTTVKVRNWDMTITTVPPYALVKDSFQNWRGMFDSGGRRVKRSIDIDINSIKFCTPEQLALYEKNGWLEGIDDVEGEMVNLRVFRNYLEGYLRTHALVHQEMTQIVRQLQPTSHGLPIELYFFTTDTRWVAYEKIQASIFEHVFAMLPVFGLRIFQSPAGTDFQGTIKSNS
jgi:miniconductance mechanosensitive channel